VLSPSLTTIASDVEVNDALTSSTPIPFATDTSGHLGNLRYSGKTYVQVNDYNKLRDLFGQLLREIQRIKSEGDYKAGKELVEKYGVKVDQKLHAEVLERYAKLDVKPYRGFIQPRLVAVKDGERIVDVRVEYPTSFFDQMMEYGQKYAFLPAIN
jgi:dipeptidyl-peptidase III